MPQSEDVGAEFLSAEETRSLICAVLADGRKVPQTELDRVLDWAHQVRVDQTLLDLVLDNSLGVAWLDGADHPKFWVRSVAA